jgi:hypothetical protein
MSHTKAEILSSLAANGCRQIAAHKWTDQTGDHHYSIRRAGVGFIVKCTRVAPWPAGGANAIMRDALRPMWTEARAAGRF